MERKALVAATLAVAVLLFGGASYHHLVQQAVPIEVKTSGFLSIGKASAPIGIILIEDFRCKNCREFSEKILPKIRSEFIQPGIARFVLVPVSFLTGSQAIANAALEVYQRHPDRFFSYLQQILIQSETGEVKAVDLIRMAQKVGGIDLATLQSAIAKGTHDQELDKNLQWAHRLMGASFRTPALFVNGVPVSTFSFRAIEERIKTIRGKKQ
jgi:protein-disulfide isomerase